MKDLLASRKRDESLTILPAAMGSAGFRVFRARPFLPVLIIIIASFAARLSSVMITSIDADEGVYLVIAQQWLQGGLPYIAVWDQHPLGLPALFALVLRAIADPILAVRLAGMAAVACTALIIHQFSLRYLRRPAAGFFGALFYIVCISRWAGLSANTEIFNNALVSFAVYGFLGAARAGPASPRAFFAALALGIGLQVKYVVFPEAVLLSLAYLAEILRRTGNWRRVGTEAAALIVAGCLPTALVLAYFWSKGALPAFIGANIGSNLRYVSLVPSKWEILKDSASGLMPIAGALAVLAVSGLRRWRVPNDGHRALSPEAWLGIWILAAFIDVCLPMKFFRHYFFSLYPPVCLAAALVLEAAWTERRRIAIFGCLAAMATAIPPLALGLARAAPWSADVPRTIAALVREAGARDGDLYVYRYQPSVYALAHLRPPTPYVMTLELSEFSESAQVNGVAEMQRIMQGKPRFIIKARGPTGDQAMAVEDILDENLKRYRLVRTFEDKADRSVVELYEHRL